MGFPVSLLGRKILDGITGALIRISVQHHEVHEGNHYYVKGFIELDIAGTFYMKMVTPNTRKWSHFCFNIKSTGICTTHFDEGAVGGMTGGSDVVPMNNNRNSSKVSGVVMKSNVSICDSYIKRLESDKWGADGFRQTIGGGGDREDELILKQNTAYLRTFISGADNNIIQFKANWYEHE